ncbi:hypothetical protein GCM10011360_23090 [Primorskyibacter flagellatus]|uniref:Uncharacterized protein n=1 Tax=Primorskyibacter flagellatus TaxID=1387277 RepID=A0A917A9C5_9RHOB|nr:hypothetical protein GCM10011360_23090 [Primorskyibacter flagellatus]
MASAVVSAGVSGGVAAEDASCAIKGAEARTIRQIRALRIVCQVLPVPDIGALPPHVTVAGAKTRVPTSVKTFVSGGRA